MDKATKKGIASKKEEPTAPTKMGPIQSYREGDVSVSIWEREYNGRVYRSCSFERSYKDASGTWKYTRNFDADDLGKLVTVAQRATEYVQSLA